MCNVNGLEMVVKIFITLHHQQSRDILAMVQSITYLDHLQVVMMSGGQVYTVQGEIGWTMAITDMQIGMLMK